MTARRFALRAVLFAATLAIPGLATAEDRRFSEHENLNEAILAARATLDLFWQVVSLEPCGCSGVVVAVRLPWEGQTLEADLIEVRRLGPGQAEGKVRHADGLAVPELADVVIPFTDDHIMDWGFGRDGEWHGLFLFQAIRAGAKTIPAEDLEAKARQKFKAITLP